MNVIQLLMAETNEYYNQYLNTLDSDTRCSGHTDVTTGNIFLAVIVLIVCDKQDMLRITGPLFNTSRWHFIPKWWNPIDFFVYFYFYIFATVQINQTRWEAWQTLEIRSVFDMLNDACTVFYNLSEHLADEQNGLICS